MPLNARTRVRGGGGGGDVIIIVPPPPPSGDRDVTYVDSFNVSDQLAGTLGPVRAPDTLDFSDTFVADNVRVVDSIDASDRLRPISNLDVRDTIDLNDRLAGTLGPVRAPDSLDFADTFVADNVRVFDSIAISDAPRAPVLSADAQDTIDLSDRIGNITQLDDDSLSVSDALGIPASAFDDSLAMSDTFGAITDLQARDTVDFSDARTAGQITTLQLDSVDVMDALRTVTVDQPEPLTIGDALRNVSLGGIIGTGSDSANILSNAVVSNTGFTNPNNSIDTIAGPPPNWNVPSYAALTATGSAGTLGLTFNSVTTNGTIVLGFPDFTADLTDLTISSAELQIAYNTTFTAGTLPSGNSVSINLDYSINDGASYTTLSTITTTAGGDVTVTFTIAATTWTHVNQLRFRATGSVTSGSSTVSASTQEFRLRGVRCALKASGAIL